MDPDPGRPHVTNIRPEEIVQNMFDCSKKTIGDSCPVVRIPMGEMAKWYVEQCSLDTELEYEK